MKKIFTAFLCAGLLCGCSDKTENQSEAVTESTTTLEAPTETEATEATASVTTTAPEPTESDPYEGHDAPPLFPVEDGADPFEVAEHYTFEVVPEGVWVYYDEIYAQLLVADTAELLRYDGPESFLTHEDYNFDLYDDLFIPEMLGRRNIPGKYFRFDPETGLFVIWNELDEAGWCSSTVNDADGTITFDIAGSSTDREETIYEWQDEKLVMVGRKVQYMSGDGMIYIDSYAYDNGFEELFYRERVLIDENGTWLGTEEVPIDE